MNESSEITLSKIKEFLVSKGGKVKYSELFDHFRNSIVDSSSDEKFQEFVSNIAIKKYENDNTFEEWIILKKKYMDSNTTSPPHTGFFASKLQKTKQNFAKFSNKAFNQYREKTDSNTLNRSSYLNSNSAHNINTLLSSSSSSINSMINSSKIYNSAFNLSTSDNMDETIITKSDYNRTIASPHNQAFLKSNSNSSSKTDTNFEVDSIISSVNSLNINSTSSINDSELIEADDSSTSINNITVINKEDEKSQVIATTSLSSLASTDQSVNIKSVKEHAKKLNRLNTEIELRTAEMSGKSNKTNSNNNNNVVLRESQNNNYVKASAKNHVELENFDFSDPKANEKEWLLVSSRGDYMDIARILSKTPYLAQKRDPFTGYTIAHWACKYGNAEILKLVASTLENDSKTNPRQVKINHLLNSKTTYGAEGLTDYSGKIGLDYSKGSSSSNDSNITNLNETKSISATPELINDANSFIKRSSSVILDEDKDKDVKDEYLNSSSVRLDDNQKSRPKISSLIFNQSPIKSSNSSSNMITNPLNPISLFNPSGVSNALISLMPPPRSNVVIRTKPKSDLNRGNDQNYQTLQDTTLKIDESKENLFI